MRAARCSPRLFYPPAPAQGVHKLALRDFLHPKAWRPPESREFSLSYEQIAALCDAAEAVFQREPTVLKLRGAHAVHAARRRRCVLTLPILSAVPPPRPCCAPHGRIPPRPPPLPRLLFPFLRAAPIKIFGDLHGQFGDLMRLFEEYGSPSTAGDITYIDYLFLGDYVDRGAHSLETICLLLALKVEHPEHVHLIRGNHEAADINALFGFRLECLERLGEAAGVKAWQRLNELFNWLPLAAVIEGRVLCMHGGIGRSINSIDQIEALQRPLGMEDGGIVLMDLLWSDPTTNDAVEGVQPSPRGPGLVTFGPDRVLDFCRNNGLQMIVRAHECVMDGFERFAQGHLITLFSATNYCGTANNAGAILVLGRDLVMVPKLIHPLPPHTPGGSPAPGGERPEEEPPTPHPGVNPGDIWMSAVNEERPPTPPRGRPGNPQQSLAFFE
jgi:diadenosine tetraphosphatase ApaH/serine/threonine PP2A family protein phosphatase